MNTRDTEIASKLAARDLITALHGLSIQCAESILAKVQLSIVTSSTFYPDEIERYRAPIRGMQQGAALAAVQLAWHIIFSHTEVDMNSEAASLAFRLWDREASLAGTRLVA